MEHQVTFRSTLDIDTNDKLTLSRILNKITQCEYLVNLEMRFSANKGIHIILKCQIECEICRFCYDDFRRFAYDQTRKKQYQNILFTEKEYIKKC